jgi:hypothetical protein
MKSVGNAGLNLVRIGCAGTLLLLIGMLAMCTIVVVNSVTSDSKPPSSSAINIPSATPTTMADAASLEIKVPEDKDKACVAYGMFARGIVVGKNEGITYSRAVQAIKRNAPAPEMANQFLQLVDVLYNKPYANKMSAEGAQASFYVECLQKIKRNLAGGRDVSTLAEINEVTASFKTFNGETLQQLLKKYGLSITHIEITPIKALFRKDGDEDGDILYNMIVEGRAKPMPCKLQKWLSNGGRVEQPAEIMVRNGRFLTDAKELHPLLYWAATNKCSTEYLGF